MCVCIFIDICTPYIYIDVHMYVYVNDMYLVVALYLNGTLLG